MLLLAIFDFMLFRDADVTKRKYLHDSFFGGMVDQEVTSI